jgi:hypothetical protein
MDKLLLKGRFCSAIGRQGEKEKTALAHFAFQSHLAAQFFDDVVHDRKTQPVSRMVAVIDLAKWREQVRPDFWRQTRGME